MIVLTIKFKPITTTIIASILMFLGVIGSMFGYVIAAGLYGLMGAKSTMEAGIGARFSLQ